MKYSIKTFGCQMNESDSERIASFLEANNFKESKANSSAEALAKADLVIFNTCGVRQTAEDRVYGAAHNLRKKNKKVFIIITGCLAYRKDVQKKLKDKVDLFIGINNLFKAKKLDIENLLEIKNSKLSKNLGSNIKKLGEKKRNGYLSIAPKYHCKQSALVPIVTGCNNFCAYCVVPYARGREWSRPVEEIINEVDILSKNGCKEITLLGQNVNSYKYNAKELDFDNCKLEIDWKLLFGNWKLKCHGNKLKNINFPLLLDLLAKLYPLITWRFLTSHPKDFSNDLIEVIKNNKNISREIHLPVQSGSNRILKMMNRPYTQKHYLDLIGKIKKEMPKAKISTDVIVGFPGETEKDFRETAKIFKKVGYFDAYINKYSPRLETAAYKLGNPISWEEKKRREKILRKLVKK